MADSKKRIALKPHMEQIRAWVDEGKMDEWIANALGTSASSVQSFRSRNDIYRREQRSPHEPESVFEGVLDHGERDGRAVAGPGGCRSPHLEGALGRR